MQPEDARKEALKKGQKDSRRRLNEIQTLLAPGVARDLSDEELKDHLIARLRASSPEERELLKLKMAAAVADLDSLVGDLSKELGTIKRDLCKLTEQTSAATAYGRWAGTSSPKGRY